MRRDRLEMVEDLARRGIKDRRVLAALKTIPRHLFIDERLWDVAYGDHPLPIDEGQTISQPYIVALMTQALKLETTDKVLEIGTGSGYQTAILAELAGEVFTVELSLKLSERARKLLVNYKNIHFKVGDGTVGWKEPSPYNKIIATGSTPKVPPSLIAQLKDSGRMVIPVGGRRMQDLLLIKKKKREIEEENLCPCSFLPLIGEEGWKESFLN